MTARVLTVRNVDMALTEGLWLLRTTGISEDSRNGLVLAAPGPVLTSYLFPRERLVTHPARDANHVFHLMETIWMLAGERNVNWLLQFNSQFGKYAEPGGLQHGAYGHRWRKMFMLDQILSAVEQLQVRGNRRVVIGMWHPSHDLGSPARDVPCNTHIYFQVKYDTLEMTVCCRSNDVIWGAYGANAVHFSMLQELMALALGVRVGTYHQFSNNYHLYTEFGQGKDLLSQPPVGTKYASHPEESAMALVPLLTDNETIGMFLVDCEKFVAGEFGRLKTNFMNTVAMPLHNAYLARKFGGTGHAQKYLDECQPCDWKTMFTQWTEKRDGSK